MPPDLPFPSFGDFFVQALRDRRLSKTEFSKAVGCGVSLVTEVSKGVRRPPLQRVPVWAEVLFPEDPVKQLGFIRHAALDHAHPIVRDWVEELRGVIPADAAKPLHAAEACVRYRVDLLGAPNRS